MGRNRQLPSQKNDEQVENLFKAATNYAVELLSGFAETTAPSPVAVLLDSLTDEYVRAKRNRCGMDPDLVKIVVQGVLDAADFPSENRPDEYDPEATEPTRSSELDAPIPIFRFVRKKGANPRPTEELAALSFTLGAVMTCYGLTLYRNAQPTVHKPLDGRVSACDAVAAANCRLGRSPATYDSLRKVIGAATYRLEDAKGKKLKASNPAMEEGKLLGEFDRSSRQTR